METTSTQSICFIDDDLIYQFTAKRIVQLVNPDQPVLVFSTGREAIEYLEMHAGEKEALPDIILVDINMPVMNGWEFLEAYSAMLDTLTKQSRVYMVSSTVDHKEKARSREFPVVKDFLIKPINQKVIIEILKEPAFNS